MGTWDHQSDLAAQFVRTSLERPGLRNESQFAIAAKQGAAATGPNDRIFRSLIASGRKLTPRNPWATLGSLIFQASLIIALAVIPLFRIDPLPKRERATIVHLDAPVPPILKVTQARAPKAVLTHAPARASIPAPVHASKEATPHPLDIPTGPSLEAGVPWGEASGATADVATSEPLEAKAPDPPPVKRIRVAAHVAEANLIHDVPPVYPAEAGRERLEGTVVLVAVIGTDGTVKDVQVESGAPILAQAAVDAVKQWRYKPYLLNGAPVEINSRITINFNVSRG